MATNLDRRQALSDAAATVLGREGLRGLTHRAVDAEAGAPTGTTSNYFRSRADLVDAAAESALAALDVNTLPEGADGLVRSVLPAQDQTVARAWVELRLLAARDPRSRAADLLERRRAGLQTLVAQLPGSDADHRRTLRALDAVILAVACGELPADEVEREAEALVRTHPTRPGGLRGLFGR